jgi:hydroxymethylpyrimidine/phosphomethylpyrimidine kinase
LTVSRVAGQTRRCGSITVMTPPIVLTIAAHDPLGGAGLAADLTTFAALGVHGAVAVTAVTAQRFGAVESVSATSAELLAAQIDGVVASYDIAAAKVGLLSDAAQVAVVASRVASGALPAPVVDPVMVDGRGNRFISAEVEQVSREALFPLSAVLTPNRAEAVLLGGDAASLAKLGAGLVVVTGGGAEGVDELVWPDGSTEQLSGEWVRTANVRGSGCTFAAATAAWLGRGVTPLEAVRAAKVFVHTRLVDGADWTFGAAETVGPVAHRFTAGLAAGR